MQPFVKNTQIEVMLLSLFCLSTIFIHTYIVLAYIFNNACTQVEVCKISNFKVLHFFQLDYFYMQHKSCQSNFYLRFKMQYLYTCISCLYKDMMYILYVHVHCMYNGLYIDIVLNHRFIIVVIIYKCTCSSWIFNELCNPRLSPLKL